MDEIFHILGGKENLFESKLTNNSWRLEGGKRKERNNDDESIDYKTSHIGHFMVIVHKRSYF